MTADEGQGARPLGRAAVVLGTAICLLTLIEVNYPRLAPPAQLSLFAALGLVLCFLNVPAHKSLRGVGWARALDLGLAALTVVCFGYVFTQNEPLLDSLWIGGQTLGNRAGSESSLDTLIGVLGLILVLEASRRTLGWALPILAGVFLAYGYLGPYLPGWLFPHRGYGMDRLVAQTFLQGQGVFGIAMNVMFTYVFLFVVFGAFLQATGATRFIIEFADRIFRGSPGGPAKVAVVSCGMMGSLSGSAVATCAVVGTLTIPSMKASGFRSRVAGGIAAAASSGGALMPPVMGAGAYMMLEIVQPPVTYLEIIRAALLPAILYYSSLLLIVHFIARRMVSEAAVAEATAPTSDPPRDAVEGTAQTSGTQPAAVVEESAPTSKLPTGWEGTIFAGALAVLITLLIGGNTPFRAVTLALVTTVGLGMFNERTRLRVPDFFKAFGRAAVDMVPLIAAAGCVGIVIGVVTLTGVGTRLPATIIPLAEQSLFLALVLIMVSSIILGMGLPSAVVYLLLATLIGPVLGDLGVVPLAAHFFIFYFGMMSMVTPPVALAAFVAASIAGADIMQTGWHAFRIALVGFTLPFIFVFRPELLMLSADGTTAPIGSIAYATTIAALGVLAFAVALAGFLFHRLSAAQRGLSMAAAALLLAPGQGVELAGAQVPILDLAGVVVLSTIVALSWKARGHVAAPA